MKRTFVIVLAVMAVLSLVSCDQEIHTHSFDEGVITAKPTCTSIGAKTYTCECGETKVEILQMLGHTEGPSETREATCTEKGGVFVKCTVCGQELSKDETTALGHDWDDGEVKTKATCASIGSILHTCKRCEEEKIEVIDKLAHEEGPEETTNSTCVEKGKKETKCTKCGEILKSEEIDALGHDWNLKERTLEPSCDTEGEEVYKCNRCTVEEKRSVKVLGHHFENGVKSKIEPTCTAVGYEYGNCTRCNKAVYTTLDKLPHTDDAGTVETEPTCTSEGKKVYHCTVCNSQTKEETLEKLPHQFEKQETITEPTCIIKEVASYKCKDCGFTEEQTLEVDATVHKNTEYRQEGEPKYFTPALNKEYCTDCKKYTGTEEEVYKSLVGFWMGEFEIEKEKYTMTLSSHENKTIEIGQAQGEALQEIPFDSYEIGTYEDTFGLVVTSSDGKDTYTEVFPYESENGESFTLGIPLGAESTVSVTFSRVTNEDHTHTFADGYSIFDMYKDVKEFTIDGKDEPVIMKNVSYSAHYQEMTCTEHTAFRNLETHDYGEDDKCIVCGCDKYYDVWVLSESDTSPQPFAVGTKKDVTHEVGVYVESVYIDPTGNNAQLNANEYFYPEGKILLIDIEITQEELNNYVSSYDYYYIKQQ